MFMEWNDHVNVTVRVYHSSMSDPLLSFTNVYRFHHVNLIGVLDRKKTD